MEKPVYGKDYRLDMGVASGAKLPTYSVGVDSMSSDEIDEEGVGYLLAFCIVTIFSFSIGWVISWLIF